MPLNSLQRRLPRSIRNGIRRRQDEKTLATLLRVQCDSSKLAQSLPTLGMQPFRPHAIGENSGAVNPGDQRAIYALAKATGAKVVLEIGTHVGGSTLIWARALPDDGHLTTVDILDVNGPEGACARLSLPSPLQQLEQEGLAGKVTFMAQDSIKFLRNCREKFDLIFLDGLHDAVQVYQEIPLALARLSAGGIVILHDVFPQLKPLWPDREVIPGPWLALERFRREGAKFKVHPLGTLPWVTKQGTNVTSLALLIGA